MDINVKQNQPLLNRQFEGSQQALEFIHQVNDYIFGELNSFVEQYDINHETAVPQHVLREVWQLSYKKGFYSATLPAEMGGMGFSLTDHILIKEAIYSSGSPLAPHVLGELSGPPRVGALAKHVSTYQMETFLKPVAQAKKSICFALTEPQAGSDAGAVQTQAVLKDDHYVINGSKRFISGSPFADFALLIASTAVDSDTRELSAFFVDLNQPGVHVEQTYKTMAGQSSTGDIVFNNYKLPVESRLGEPGQGLRLALGRITVNRLLHCPAMLGLAYVALKDARDYALTRQQFGQPIANFQAIQHSLADMLTQLMAARGLMLTTAKQIEMGNESRAEASMTKLFCSESAFNIADKAVQIHGGAGIIHGTRVEFLFRMLRMYRILTGTSEIQKNTIAKAIL